MCLCTDYRIYCRKTDNNNGFIVLPHFTFPYSLDVELKPIVLDEENIEDVEEISPLGKNSVGNEGMKVE